MKRNILLASFSLIMVMLWSALAIAASEKKIIYLTGCQEQEVVSDIETSIQGITSFAKENSIELVNQKDKRKCGYVLVWKEKKKGIDSALTDVDLAEESEVFFKLKKK